MDYLESLRVFRCVVETKSFTRTAEMLGITTPVVSRTISKLEARLANRLFHRTTRQITLTETAEHFYEGCVRILDDLEALEAGAAAATREPNGILRLVAHTTATVHLLVPLIASYKRAQPNVRLEVTLTERPVDLVADGYDLGLLLPFMLGSDQTVTRLLQRIPMKLVATPGYVAAHGMPAHPSELSQHVFVATSPSIRKPNLMFRVGQQEVSVALKYDISSNNAIFNREMVLRDLGLGMLPAALVKPALEAGTLLPVLSEFELLDSAIEIRLAYNIRTLLPAKVRAFVNHATMFFEAASADSDALGLAG